MAGKRGTKAEEKPKAGKRVRPNPTDADVANPSLTTDRPEAKPRDPNEVIVDLRDLPEPTKRRRAREDLAHDSVLYWPPGALESFARWRRVGTPDEVYKIEAVEMILDLYLENLVEKLVELGVETMLPRDQRKSIRLGLSTKANKALDKAAARTGLDKLHLLVAAVRLAAQARDMRANEP